MVKGVYTVLFYICGYRIPSHRGEQYTTQCNSQQTHHFKQPPSINHLAPLVIYTWAHMHTYHHKLCYNTNLMHTLIYISVLYNCHMHAIDTITSTHVCVCVCVHACVCIT